MYNKYYYLIASLPYLKFDEKNPLSIEDFVQECAKWTSANDLKILKSIDINTRHIYKEDTYIVKKWKIFNNTLKEELAKIRALRAIHPAEKSHSALDEIYEEPNPLLMEKRIERIRWDFLEQQEFYYSFDINWLIIYVYKLHILERLASFNKEKGMQVFNELCTV